MRFAPDPSVLFVGRVFPQTRRRAMLFVPWGAVAFAFLAAIFLDAVFLSAVAFAGALAIATTFALLFIEHGIEEPKLPDTLERAVVRARGAETVNLAAWCSAEVLRAVPIITAPTVNRTLRQMLESERAQRILLRLGIPREAALMALKTAPDEELPERFSTAMFEAATHAVRLGHDRIMFADAFIAFVRNSAAMTQFLFDREFDLHDVDAVAHWEDRRAHEEERKRAFWSRENLFAIRPFGRAWSYGYTPTLDRYAIDVTAKIESAGSTFQVLGRAAEIRALERALARMASANALLIGEPGVGVEEVIAGFAKRVLTGKSLPLLNYRRVIAADFGAAIAGLQTVGEMEGRVRKMLSEAARAGGTILVIQDFHTLLNIEGGTNPIDLTASFLPFLEGTRLQIVATTTYQGLHSVIEKRESIAPLFERIEVREPDAAQALQVLFEGLPVFESRFRIFVPYGTLKAIIAYADRTIQDVPFPKKAFDVLEASLIAAAGEGAKVLTADHVARVISERTEIPVGALTTSEKKKLLNLEAWIHERIIDQDEAVRAIADALRRARAGVSSGATTRPIGTFLFLGPTGVGKTETAKALAEVYFGDEKRMIRLDMSEFQGVDAIDRLIGSPATGEEGRLTTAVRENPFTLILLDEFEKANVKILDLFLPILDEGRIKDAFGRNVSFTHTLIIATSNAGAEFIRERLREGQDFATLQEALREEVLRRELFRPELLNRFDGVIIFKPLGKTEVRLIAEKLLEKLAQTLMREKGIGVVVDSDALDMIIERGFQQEFGARELRRVLQDSVETVVAKKLLEGAERGETIRVALSDLIKKQ